MTCVFVFDTTHHALWAEQLVLDARVAAQVIPAPADTEARCDLALECLSTDREVVERVLRGAGVPFRAYPA
jgi:hypothetical protein